MIYIIAICIGVYLAINSFCRSLRKERVRRFKAHLEYLEKKYSQPMQYKDAL